ncbi:amidohydrolase 2 [Lophiostoma macrostomum CBS 122681]|uniref:6-methylsalicylate decarboxylase n=1 Tax=Lophiostoma macrostomum CBS 122681 TaxID=1314788 RepID=A0A6A6TC20_9PLEO|nr:amidohydrolase 2 [Lophiostoma macrostomum CBS 122681]
MSNTNPPLSPRIDVHSHFLPDFYTTALHENGHSHPDGMPAIPPWSLSAHLSNMSSSNITRSILSISSPGTNLTAGNAELATTLTRRTNSFASTLTQQHPSKLSYWASLPLPYIAPSLTEIDAAASTCAGFALLTNYHGTYIGDASLAPVFARLNELHATVFIHPTAPCTQHSTPASAHTSPALPLGAAYPVPMFEFLFDTARAVINLFLTGTVDAYPHITYIVPHVGGAFPPLISRFLKFSTVIPGGRVLDPQTVHRQLQSRFYFDIAGFAFDGEEGGAGQVRGLVEGGGVGADRLLYGSDFPFTPEGAVRGLAVRMEDGLKELFGEEGREGVYEGNARRLLEGSELGKAE